MYNRIVAALKAAGFMRIDEDFIAEESAEDRVIEYWVTDASNGKPYRQILVLRDGFADNGRCAVFGRIDQTGAAPDKVTEFISNGYDLISAGSRTDPLPTQHED